MQQLVATIVDRRSFGGLSYLVLQSPELARAARAGHYLLLRCAPLGARDPLLLRALFVAGADPQAGLVRLLFAPDERGLAWLAAQLPGMAVELSGPLGIPFSLERGTRHLLLIGAGPALPSLLMLAHEALRREIAVVLLLAAEQDELLPPPFLLPAEVEYQRLDELQLANSQLPIVGQQARSTTHNLQSALAWADQLAAAVPLDQLPPLVEAVRRAKLRWERGFAQVALGGPMPCVTGACLSCLVETRAGLRLRCKDGPVFDLRELR